VNDELDNLKKLLARLPGLGEKSGARLAYHLWRAPGQYSEELARAILAVREKIGACPVCGNPTSEDKCVICKNPERDQKTIMVVESPQDLAAIESTRSYTGLYHVLHGTLSPLAGKGPGDINLESLARRAAGAAEVILATNPSAEGDATASYIEERLAAEAPDVKLSRLARGMTVGSEIKYLDPLSIQHALKGRQGK
jgi:recombination protein RecR